jgi:hypothetical protein
MEPGNLVGSKSREQHHQVSRNEHIDVIKLQQTESINHSPYVTGIDRGVRAIAVESLRRKRNSAGFR